MAGRTSPAGSGTSGGTVKSSRVFHDGTTNRVLIGFRPKGAGGIRVSKVGVDVLTGTPDQMVMDSLFDMFKIVAVGTVIMNKPPTTTLAISTTPHNLGYSPIAFAFIDLSFLGGTGPFLPLQRVLVDLTSGLIQETYLLETDAENIYIAVNTPSWAGNNSYTFGFNVAIKYYLMQETAV